MKPAADPVAAYARDVLAGKTTAGRLVGLACERHLRDLKRRDLVWDLAAAKRAINFFPDVLRLGEGKPFTLLPWQQFNIGSWFGWKTPAGNRRFRVAYVETGKGSGKTPLGAGTALYMGTADGEERAECYFAAVDREQAAIAFRDAVAMVDLSPALSAKIVRSGGHGREWNLAYPRTSSFLRPIASEAQGRGKSGPRPHFVLLDEIHEHPTNAMVEFMRAGTKNRRNALILGITNSGWDRTSVCWAHHEYGVKVLTGALEDDSRFVFIASLDPCAECLAKGREFPACPKCDQWTDEAVWEKSNPSLVIDLPPRTYLRELVTEARGMPSKENIVRRFNFTEWTQQEQVWLPIETWTACRDESVTAESLRGRECVAGLDLSSSIDLAALAVYFPPRTEEEKACALFYFWLPTDAIAERMKENRAPFDLWVRRGLIETTPGNVIDYGFIRKRLNLLREENGWKFREVAFDPWGATQLATDLQDDGFLMVKFPQTIAYFSPPMKEMERLLAARKFAHDGNEVAAWCVGNVAPRIDGQGNIRPDRARSRANIDGAVALLEAQGRAMVTPAQPTSIYESRGPIVLGG